MAECLCGCGEQVVSRFRPGHDARLKSRLFAAARDGNQTARATIEQMGWLHLYDKSVPRPAKPEPKINGNMTIRQKAKAYRDAASLERGEPDPEVNAERRRVRQAQAEADARRHLEWLMLMKQAAAILNEVYPKPRPQVTRDNAQMIVDCGPDRAALDDALGMVLDSPTTESK